jgi:GGDEF domain-containing protein
VAEATAPPAEEPAPESVRDARRPPSDALWVGALQDEIARSGRSGTPLSLLLVELEDADRIASVEPEDEVAATFGRFAQAVRRAMRRQDLLACESDSRAWIIARDTGRPGAQALGARVVESVREAKPWRGAPMAVNVGVAVLGEDGADHSSLMEAAEESRFAAEASGIAVVRAAPQDEPRGPGPRLVS